MIISIALPSNVSILEKTNYVQLANSANLGVFVSDLPQNHDLFQLLSVWKERFPRLPNIGTAIISPFVYEKEFIIKQIKTLFENFDNGIELGFGLGDKNLLKKVIQNRIESFQMNLKEILSDETIKQSQNICSIAGSGKKLLNFANNQELGILYNGIINPKIISFLKNKKTRENVSSYVMADINEYKNLSPGFVSIVSRIITGLSTKELVRLNIEKESVKRINEQLSTTNPSDYQQWLPEYMIKKVAIIGSKEEIIDQLNKFISMDIKQVILSIVGSKNKVDFLNYINTEKLKF